MKDFYLKLYDFQGNIKKVESRTIIGKSNFSAQIDSSFSDCKIQIRAKINNTEYKIGDFIKIFYGNDLYFQGYIVYIARFLNNTNEYIEITIIPKGSFISSKKFTKNYNDTAKNIIADIISCCNSDFGIPLLSEGNIEDMPGIISLKIKDKSYLEALQELVKSINGDEKIYMKGSNGGCYYMNNEKKVYVDKKYCEQQEGKHFFIDLEGVIFFGEQNKKHHLALEKNIVEIQIGETDSEVTNSATLTDSTKLKVSNQYNFREILPLHQIKIQNVLYKMKPLRVDRINFDDLGAEIDLESFTSFSNLIKNLGN